MIDFLWFILLYNYLPGCGKVFVTMSVPKKRKSYTEVLGLVNNKSKCDMKKRHNNSYTLERLFYLVVCELLLP